MSNEIRIEFNYNVKYEYPTNFAIYDEGDNEFEREDIVKALELVLEYAKTTWLLEPKIEDAEIVHQPS